MGRGAVPSPALASGSVSFYFWPRGVLTAGLLHLGGGAIPSPALASGSVSFLFIFGHAGSSLLGSCMGGRGSSVPSTGLRKR